MEAKYIFQQIFIVKVFDGMVESFYFSTEDLAMQFINSRKMDYIKELSGFEMKDYGTIVHFSKGEEEHTIMMEMDYLDFVR